MPLPERGATRGDRVLDTSLRESDHVGVALDHEYLARLRDRRACAVQVVEDLVLLVDRRLSGVEVLRLLPRLRVTRQHPRPEPDAAALKVMDREDQPPSDSVAHRAVVAAGRQTRLE